jgi:oxygen-independent coproporphyrinogen-3 oxidase
VETSVYIHIPFCVRKCLYCDFVSYPEGKYSVEKYIGALSKELEMYPGLAARTVYIGGGTPTCIDLKYLDLLFDILYRHSDLKGCSEFSIEANPGTLTVEKLKCLSDAGVNRLSIGLQSWQDSILKMLGRIHSREDFVSNYLTARKLGFDNINVDLIFGVPMQSVGEWMDTIARVADLEPDHLSCYSLMIEEGTPFHRMLKNGLIKEIDQETDRDMYHFAVEYLYNKGYKRYEISNFAKEGKQCLHNITYWRNRSYIGIGLAAHSYIDGVRRWNTGDMEDYLRMLNEGVAPVGGSEKIDHNTGMFETIFLGLRMTDGVMFEDFRERFGVDILGVYSRQIETLQKKGLINVKHDRFCLTDKGIDLSNRVFGEFMDNCQKDIDKKKGQ